MKMWPSRGYYGIYSLAKRGQCVFQKVDVNASWDVHWTRLGGSNQMVCEVKIYREPLWPWPLVLCLDIPTLSSWFLVPPLSPSRYMIMSRLHTFLNFKLKNILCASIASILYLEKYLPYLSLTGLLWGLNEVDSIH